MADNLLFDASAILNLVRRQRLETLVAGCTLPLARYEVGNAVWRQVYLRRTLTLAEGTTALEAVAAVMDRLPTRPIDGSAVLALAVQTGLTYYDAAYLQAAIHGDGVLVTDDATLAAAAQPYVETRSSEDL